MLESEDAGLASIMMIREADKHDNRGENCGFKKKERDFAGNAGREAGCFATEASKRRRRSRIGCGALAVVTSACVICVVILFVCVPDLRKETTDVQDQLYNVQASVDSISSSIAAQVENILAEQNSILTQLSLELESADYVNKTVVMLDGLPDLFYGGR